MIQHGSNGRKCHKWQSIYYPFFFFFCLFYHQGRRDSKIKRKLFLIYFKINWNFQWKDNKIKKYNKINTLAWPVRLQWKWVVENPTYPGVPEIAANIFFSSSLYGVEGHKRKEFNAIFCNHFAIHNNNNFYY